MRRITWAALAAALLAATVAAPASAKVDRIPVSYDSYVVAELNPGVFWVSGNVWHQRDWSFEMRTYGTGAEGNEYVEGSNVFESFNLNINCLTGKGALSTEFTWTVALDENSGWVGTSSGHYSGYNCVWPPDYQWTIESKFVAHGFGQFEGLEFRGVDIGGIDDEGIPYHYGEGYIMIPG